jgi:AcrR family transcriptional regulator
MSRREQKKQQARIDILTAASDLIGRLGYEQAKMRDIAEAANISYQTLYNYFPTKALILQELLMQQVEDTAGEIASLTDNYDGDLLETLRQINAIRIEMVCRQDRNLWLEVFLGLLKHQQEATQLAQLIDSAAHDAFGIFFATVQQRGDLDPTLDVELLAHMVFALTEQAFLQYFMIPSMSTADLIESINEQTATLVRPYLVSEGAA